MYEGERDPKTKLRHGQGTYHYPNKFFTYQGQYWDGIKHGKGVLSLNNGTTIKGEFVDG